MTIGWSVAYYRRLYHKHHGTTAPFLYDTGGMGDWEKVKVTLRAASGGGEEAMMMMIVTDRRRETFDRHNKRYLRLSAIFTVMSTLK